MDGVRGLDRKGLENPGKHEPKMTSGKERKLTDSLHSLTALPSQNSDQWMKISASVLRTVKS